MTLVTAWIRERPDRDELIVASDSRLSFGARWDCCPKVFPLAREDSVLAFCGDTAFAYPILLQLSNSVTNYRKSRSREQDITSLRPHLLKVIEHMRKEVHSLPKGNSEIDTKDFKLLFAGYSWRRRQFKAWSLYYDTKLQRFHYRPLTFHKKQTGGTKPVLFMGDHVMKAYGSLYHRLAKAGNLQTGPLDMEPLEVLGDLIEDCTYESISGPPQIVKIYPYARTLPINVLWPRKRPTFIAHYGRPLLDYESSDFACLDLDSMELLSPQRAFERIGS